MELLLDTHVFLWAAADPAALAPEARAAIEDSGNRVFVSAAVTWEIAIKRALGKLTTPADPAVWFPARMRSLGFAALPISIEHTLAVGALPAIHSDPFDRIQIAQAQLEGLRFVTRDPQIQKYRVAMLVA